MKLKLYAVFDDMGDDRYDFLGVFSSHEKAEEFIEKHRNSGGYYTPPLRKYFSIEIWEVDEGL